MAILSVGTLWELFRRDSRNIEILIYDELYKRAKFIVSYSSKEKKNSNK